MTDLPEKLDLTSHNISEDKKHELLRLFPEIRTEGDKIDFDRLKLVLGETVDAGRERYGMTWSGKADCFKTIQAPSVGTLLPAPEESVNFDTTENLVIEGDNLEVLKLLQKAYLGKVKMIYIDPPYNTGNDFIYPDNYTESLQTYLEFTGQIDIEGKKFGTNIDTAGRFHSRWLNMMYPRLYLARNLLRNDGVIFISIDDNELENLLMLLNEIFGEENGVGIISWKNVTDNNPTLITKDNEYIICFAKSIEAQPKTWKSQYSESKEILQAEYERLRAMNHSNEKIQSLIREFIDDNYETIGLLTRYKFVDDLGVYTGSESVHNPRPGGYDFEVYHPSTGKPMRKPASGYRFPEATFRQMERDGIIIFGEDENRIVKIKKYLKDYEETLRSVFVMDGRLGSYDLKRVFNIDSNIFTNPKPVDLLKTLISYVMSPHGEEIAFDFFAGSGTLGHAILELNKQDSGNRKFILVQLPEVIKNSSYPTIAEITKARIKRVIEKLAVESIGKEKKNVDLGFRVFKLSNSNFQSWDASILKDRETLERQLELHINHVRPGRTNYDILFEILLKSGFILTTSIDEVRIAERMVYKVANGSMIIYLEGEITLEVIRGISEEKPQRVVCMDSAFHGNDQLKTNVVQVFKTKDIVFRTI